MSESKESKWIEHYRAGAWTVGEVVEPIRRAIALAEAKLSREAQA